MPLIDLVVTLVVVAILLWALNTYGSPIMDGKILQLINIIIVIACVLYVLHAFGVFPSKTIRVGGLASSQLLT